jgi:hypothetical protein
LNYLKLIICRSETIEYKKTEKPVIVEELIKPVERVEIQPVIHREREQVEVHHIVQPIQQQEIRPISYVREETLPMQEMGVRKLPQ